MIKLLFRQLTVSWLAIPFDLPGPERLHTSPEICLQISIGIISLNDASFHFSVSTFLSYLFFQWTCLTFFVCFSERNVISFLFLKNFIYLFIFGCIGSSLLCVGFL